ncbi:hypothetical protein [Streptomyces sp. NPDC054771]
MVSTLMVDQEAELDLSDLDLDIQTVVTGDVAAPLRPAMFTAITCDVTGATGTSCNLTNGCNPMCC